VNKAYSGKWEPLDPVENRMDPLDELQCFGGTDKSGELRYIGPGDEPVWFSRADYYARQLLPGQVVQQLGQFVQYLAGESIHPPIRSIQAEPENAVALLLYLPVA
jgi:hypothetical protein